MLFPLSASLIHAFVSMELTHPVSGSFKNGRAANAVATKGIKRVWDRILKRVAEMTKKSKRLNLLLVRIVAQGNDQIIRKGFDRK